MTRNGHGADDDDDHDDGGGGGGGMRARRAEVDDFFARWDGPAVEPALDKYAQMLAYDVTGRDADTDDDTRALQQAFPGSRHVNINGRSRYLVPIIPLQRAKAAATSPPASPMAAVLTAAVNLACVFVAGYALLYVV